MRTTRIGGLSQRALIALPAFLLALCPTSLAQPTASAQPEALLEQVRVYDEHVTTLANPFFGGREPGSRGNILAAEYIESELRELGLKPAFYDDQRAAAETSGRETYRQVFEMGQRVTARKRELRYVTDAGHAVPLEPLTEATVIEYSADGRISAPIAFAGYAIEEGDEGFTSFAEGDDFEGRIALILRFEPMNEDGRSRWVERGWTPAASLRRKLRAPIHRGASAVILVSPPGADDPRVGKLMDVEADRGSISMRMSAPVMMMSAEKADEMVRALDLQGRSLEDFVAIANAGVGEGAAETGVIPLPGGVVSMDVELEREPITTENVGAILPGRGSLAGEFLVIGAHFDHVGLGAFGTRSPGRVGEVHPGADDNASGTSGVLLAAQKLSEAYRSLPDNAEARSIVFLLFSGEERGLLGSRHFTEHPSVPLESIACMLNMDMIGRLRDGLEVEGLDQAEVDDRIAEIVRPILDKAEIPVAMRGPTGNSDHATFRAKGVQILNFHTGLHDEYHTPDDIASTIDDASAVRVVDLVTEIALAIATDGDYDADDAEDAAADESGTDEQVDEAQPKVTVGVVIIEDQEAGVVIAELEEGSPAAQAGVLEGDRIVRWNNEEIKDAGAWHDVLMAHAPGDFVEFYVMRDGKPLRMFAILKAP